MLPRKKAAAKPRSSKKKPATKKPVGKSASTLEDRFLKQIRDSGLPEPVREYAFDAPPPTRKKRRWRADMAWVDERILAEVEGGVWGSGKRCFRCKQRAPGRHNSPVGFEKDCEKYGHAVAQGWRVLRVTTKMVRSGLGIALLEELFKEAA